MNSYVLITYLSVLLSLSAKGGCSGSSVSFGCIDESRLSLKDNITSASSDFILSNLGSGLGEGLILSSCPLSLIAQWVKEL